MPVSAHDAFRREEFGRLVPNGTRSGRESAHSVGFREALETDELVRGQNAIQKFE